MADTIDDRPSGPGGLADRPARRPARPRNWAALLLVLLAGAGIAWFSLRGRSGRSPPLDPAAGWLSDPDAAQAQAKVRGLPLLMVFSQPGCSYCDLLKEQVLSRPQFEAAARGRVVLADLDIVADRASMGRFREYGGRATPTLVLVDPAGGLIAFKEGGRGVEDWLADGLRRWELGGAGAGGGPATRPAEPPASGADF